MATPLPQRTRHGPPSYLRRIILSIRQRICAQIVPSMAALKAAFGTNQIAFSYNSTVTSTVRQYATPDDFLNEIILARIHGGMHFRTANVQGGVLGTSVGEWVAKNYFQPR